MIRINGSSAGCATDHSISDTWFTTGNMFAHSTARKTYCERNSATANTSVKFNLFSSTAINRQPPPPTPHPRPQSGLHALAATTDEQFMMGCLKAEFTHLNTISAFVISFCLTSWMKICFQSRGSFIFTIDRGAD